MAKFTGHTITSDSALGAAKIQRSLRFNRADSAHLTYTPASASTDRTKITISVWVKKIGVNDGEYSIFHGGTSSNDRSQLRFYHSGGLDNLSFFARVSGTFILQCDTSAKFRDSTAWYHIVARCDTTNGTANIYVNGEDQTLSTSTKPSGSQSLTFFNNVEHQIGERGYDGSTSYMHGYMAEMNVIQGQALDPSYFGFTDPVTGIWMPKRYEGTYGDGFYLDFSDNSSTSTLGIDKSPNGNDFTANNFSVAAWPDNDSVIDTPTNNFNTFNENDKNSNVPLVNGGLETAATATGGHYPAFTAIPVKSGKWYLEWKFLTNDSGIPAIMEAVHDGNSYNTDSTVGNNTSTVNKRGYGFLPGNGNTSAEGGYASYGSALTSSDIGQCAFDADTGKIYWGKNNTWFNSGNPETGANPAFSGIDMTKEYLFTWHVYGNNNNVSVNFGSQGFTYTPPSGFKALCTENLSLKQTPSAIKPQRHFETLLYTGTGGSHNVTGLEFEPDLVWAKNRQDAGYHHDLYDTVRGNNLRLFSSQSQGEATGYLQFGVNGGFSLTAGGGININTKSHVAWCWKAGGAAVSNSDGSITSSISANQTAGFSIVTWTGTGSAGTIGHGLGDTPKIVIVKRRSGEDNWQVYWIGAGTERSGFLSLTNAFSNGANTSYWGTSEPTSTVFSVGSSATQTNASGETYVAYCWSEIPGYSKFGEYTGNGSSTGNYVHCGFRPRWIMTKRVSGGTGNWYIWDTVREFNVNNSPLQANDAGSEPANYDNSIDILSDGFKLRASNAGTNGNGDTYMFMAFAEQSGVTPFNTFPNAH